MNTGKLQLFRQKELYEEARRRYRMTNENFKEIRGRMAILFSAELAIMTYLFSDLISIFPSEAYGRVIFILACLGILFSTGILFIYYRSIYDWPVPTGDADREKIKQLNSEIEILEYLENDYILADKEAQKILTKRAKIFNLSMHIFIISAIILLTIKIF